MIPVGTSDYIFAAIAEEFGIIVAIGIIALYLVFIIRGILIAMDARTKFDKLLVFGATAMLSLQSFIIIGGVIKLIPLTGITMPFVSSGGSSMRVGDDASLASSRVWRLKTENMKKRSWKRWEAA